jgi:dienelactone hydrolase
MIKEQEKKLAPTVLISHGSACVVPGVYMWADMLHSWGYNAVVIDHCSLRGIGSHTGAFYPPANLQNEDRVEDYLIVANWLDSQPWHNGKTGLVGFSRGGDGVIHLASSDWYIAFQGYKKGYNSVIDAAVAYYPSCRFGSHSLIGTPFPVLFHHGTADQLTTIGYCRYPFLLRDERLKDKVTVFTYDNAHHGFDRPGSRITNRGLITKEYDHSSATKSYEETKSFFNKTLQLEGS